MKVIVSKQGDNGKKINLPKAIWDKLNLNVGDHIEFVVNKKGKIEIKKGKI
ncbi:MAG: AbrB/MazE/SpoVT family DNA-binding domain-containing protein [Fusobacteriaceae bacterium]